MRRGILSTFFIVLAVVFAGGCGGSSDSDSLTKAEFVKRAEAICAKHKAQVENDLFAYIAKNTGEKSPSKAVQGEAVTKTVVPIYRAELEEIEALGAPSDDEDQVGEILSSFEGGIAATEADPVRAFRVSGQFTEFSKLANAYGLKICAQV